MGDLEAVSIKMSSPGAPGGRMACDTIAGTRNFVSFWQLPRLTLVVARHRKRAASTAAQRQHGDVSLSIVFFLAYRTCGHLCINVHGVILTSQTTMIFLQYQLPGISVVLAPFLSPQGSYRRFPAPPSSTTSTENPSATAVPGATSSAPQQYRG